MLHCNTTVQGLGSDHNNVKPHYILYVPDLRKEPEVQW